ncbi:MAG TPA: hypothetical protein VE980_08765 [Pyrinomonadaceae bacterium]|nr:hypothetical protein [Pyrinomonadaceae bacterium]
MIKTRSLPLLFLFLFACSSVAYSQALVEEFSFEIKDFKMDHQTQTNNLNISISYRYIANIQKSQYPDFRWLAKDVENLLSNYPNKDDYWEIVNKQVTSMLLNKYPGIMSVTCEMKVDPSSLIPYTRSSRVTRYRTTSKAIRKRT